MMKPVDELTPQDFATHRVWEFVNDAETELPHEAFVRPVHDIPITSADSRLIGTTLILADGRRVSGFLGNIDLRNSFPTEHFLTVTVFNDAGQRFDLARYHDVDSADRGPAALARFLRSDVDSVFPMRYDISDVATGDADSIRAAIPAAPRSQLSEDQLIELALR
jgi:hypothetical protein